MYYLFICFVFCFFWGVVPGKLIEAIKYLYIISKVTGVCIYCVMKIKDGADLNLDSRVFQKVLEGNNDLTVSGDEPTRLFQFSGFREE